MTHLSHTLLNALLRMAGAPEHTLSKVAARLGTKVRPAQAGDAAPDHVVMRLESVFEALSDLAAQPSVGAAFDLACHALQAELPTEAVAAGLYDIDSDEIRIVSAGGAEPELLCGAVLPRARCVVGYAAESAIITRGDEYGADWLCGDGQATTVLLCPIRQDSNLLGLLALADPLCAADFDQYDVELVSYVASQLGVYLQTQRHSRSIAAR
jgi:GAF domain-containing protein